MSEYLSAVMSAVTLAVLGLLFVIAKKSPALAERIIEAVGMLAFVIAAFLIGVSVGLGMSKGAVSVSDASDQSLVYSWILLGFFGACIVCRWVIGVLHRD